jgi:hypothetical protein
MFFFLSCLFFIVVVYKIGEQEGRIGPVELGGRRADTSGRGRWWEKGVRG